MAHRYQPTARRVADCLDHVALPAAGFRDDHDDLAPTDPPALGEAGGSVLGQSESTFASCPQKQRLFSMLAKAQRFLVQSDSAEPIASPSTDAHLSDNHHLKGAPAKHAKHTDAEERYGDSRIITTVAYDALGDVGTYEHAVIRLQPLWCLREHRGRAAFCCDHSVRICTIMANMAVIEGGGCAWQRSARI